MNNPFLTITYLSHLTLGNPNCGDKDLDNTATMKKFVEGSQEFPFVSSQCVRHNLREKLAELGFELSPVTVEKEKVPKKKPKDDPGEEGADALEEDECIQTKAPPHTALDPVHYIDDDLFGFMSAKKSDTRKRTSVVKVSHLISLVPYRGDVDFGANFAGVNIGGNPTPFDTEIHSGTYMGTISIELDRIGCNDDGTPFLEISERIDRAKALIRAIKYLNIGGRQSSGHFNLSPIFVAAALMKVKNPIFLDSLKSFDYSINFDGIIEAVNVYHDMIASCVIGGLKTKFGTEGFFAGMASLDEAFNTMEAWIDKAYKS